MCWIWCRLLKFVGWNSGKSDLDENSQWWEIFSSLNGLDLWIWTEWSWLTESSEKCDFRVLCFKNYKLKHEVCFHSAGICIYSEQWVRFSIHLTISFTQILLGQKKKEESNPQTYIRVLAGPLSSDSSSCTSVIYSVIESCAYSSNLQLLHITG